MAQYRKYSQVGKDDNAPEPQRVGEVPKITAPEHRHAIVKGHRLTVIDNYTEWCEPCKQCASSYAVLAAEYSRPGLCALVKEDVDDKIPGQKMPIDVVPCFHFYIDGVAQQHMTITGGNIDAVGSVIKGFLNPDAAGGDQKPDAYRGPSQHNR